MTCCMLFSTELQELLVNECAKVWLCWAAVWHQTASSSGGSTMLEHCHDKPSKDEKNRALGSHHRLRLDTAMS
jgi:hypothetical protein